MSYRQSDQPTFTNHQPNRARSPNALAYVIHRKPPANYSSLPHPPSTPQSSASQQPDHRSSLSSSAARAAARTSSTDPVTPESNTSNIGGWPHPGSVPAHTGTLTQNEVDAAFRSCLAILKDAITHHAKRPFAALLLAPDNATVLLTHNEISHVQHAESELARLASLQYSLQYLNRCTLVSTWEPCAMCAGTIYWSGIGRVLYAASEKTLKELIGPDNNDYASMGLPCRTVLNAGVRTIEVLGPVTKWEDDVVQSSQSWWDERRGQDASARHAHQRISSDNLLGPGVSVMTTADSSMLGSIGDDGEYQADLKVDWMI